MKPEAPAFKPVRASLLFFYSRYKILLSILCLSFIILFWPACLRFYSHRYLYPPLPFLIIFFIVALLSLGQYKKYYSFLWVSIFIYLVSSICYLVFNFHITAKDLQVPIFALKKLVLNNDIKNNNLCFIALPSKFFISGIAQALWMNGHPTQYKVFNDRSIGVYGSNISHLKLDAILNDKAWYLALHNIVNEGFYGTSHDSLSMGNIEITKKDYSNKHVIEIIYTLDQKWLEYDPYFITWDYQKNEFKLLGKIKR